MDKSRVKGILLNYLNDYYAEYPEELDSGEIANWGELDSYYEDYPEIFQKLVNGDPDDPEVEELWNFAEKVWAYCIHKIAIRIKIISSTYLRNK